MLKAFLYGGAVMMGVLVVYTIYDGIYTYFVWLKNRKNSQKQSSKRRRR